MLNAKRPCPFEDDESRPFKKRLANLAVSTTVTENKNKPQPNEPKSVNIPIEEDTLENIKEKVNEAMVYLKEAAELGKVVEKKYTKEILSCIGLLNVFLRAAKASTDTSPSPDPSPKVKKEKDVDLAEWSRPMPIQAPKKPQRPKLFPPKPRLSPMGFTPNPQRSPMGFAPKPSRKGQFNDRPMRGGSSFFGRPPWLNGPSNRGSFRQNFQSNFLRPGTFGKGWGSRGRGSMRGRGGYGRGAWRGREKPPAKKYYCKVCKLECNSIEQYTAHNSGKNHKQKLKNMGIQQQQPRAKPAKKEQNQYHCEICNINCAGLPQWNAHQAGKKHKTKLRAAAPGPSAHPKGKFYCSICLMDCTAQSQWDAHIRGKTHANNLASLGRAAK